MHSQSQNESFQEITASDGTGNRSGRLEQNADVSSYVTDSDYQAQRKIDFIRIRVYVYCVCAVLLFLGGTLPMFIVGKKSISFGVNCWFWGFVGFVAFALLAYMVNRRKNKIYKKEIVQPVLKQMLGYNPEASDYFKHNAPLKKIFRKMYIGRRSTEMIISDCIFGRVGMAKFAFIDFELKHDEGKNSRNVTDFCGQAFIAPVNDKAVLSFDNTPVEENLQKNTKLFEKLLNVFNESWNRSPQDNSNYSLYNNSGSNAEDKKIPTGLAERQFLFADFIVKHEMTAHYHCVEDMFIWIVQNDSDLFEHSKEDKTKDLKNIKKRIVEEANWIRSEVETLANAGII